MAAVVCGISTSALSGPCDGLTGDLQGLCNAFCVAKNCASPTSSKGSTNSCNVLKNNFTQKAGYAPPCLTTLISVCPSTIGLKAGGKARSFTITNNGSVTAMGVTATPTGLPNDASITPVGCASIAPGGTCLITVTPGSTASAPAGNVSPPLIAINITGDNTNGLSTTANIVTFGSVYQSGYVYAIDDTTQAACTNTLQTASIGGKATSLTDQAAPYPNGIVWGSNGTSGTTANVDNFNIPGIYETSIPPTSVCDGKYDGQCDSGQILLHYAAVNPAFYAAGKCDSFAGGGNADWYLPAICEMGPVGPAATGCAPGTPNMMTNLPNLLGVADSSTGALSTACAWGNNGLSSTNCLAGYYWSSTEASADAQYLAWGQFVDSVSGNVHVGVQKEGQLGVRCSRALSL